MRGERGRMRAANVTTRRAPLPGAAELFRTTTPSPPRPARQTRAIRNAAPTRRQRHEEKITVYCSRDELLDLEMARLALRVDHGLAVDRGRIVREALAVVLADLESKGADSILVRRLREP